MIIELEDKSWELFKMKTQRKIVSTSGTTSVELHGLTLSPTPQFKTINSSALGFLHSPAFTSIPDYWKNHSLD